MDFTTRAKTNIAAAHNVIIEVRTFQMFQANQKQGEDIAAKKRNLVYLLTKNLNLPKNQARKLCPKYIKISKTISKKSTYTLELPTALQEHWIHLTFHESLLKPYHASCDSVFLN